MGGDYLAKHINNQKILMIVTRTIFIISLFILICSCNDTNKPNVVKAPLYESLSKKNSRIDDIVKYIVKKCKRDALLNIYNTNHIKHDEFEIIFEFIPLYESGFSEKDYRYSYVTGNKKHCYYRDSRNNGSYKLRLSHEICGYLSNDVNKIISKSHSSKVVDSCYDCECYLFHISNSKGFFDFASFGFPDEKSIKRIFLYVNSTYFNDEKSQTQSQAIRNQS